MISIYQIRTIAHFEAKTLFRSWFFRILGLLMLTFLFFFNLAMVVFKEETIQQAVPSSIPYSNLLFFNIVQAIIAVFLATDFLKRDKKLDTTEVIYTRSMSNGDYVIGKLLGNLMVFTILNLTILVMALVFNLIVGLKMVSWISYLYYFLLISFPTLIFIIGLSFILMGLVKNQAVTFALLIGYIFLTMFYLQNQYYYLFDYMVYNIPMLYSDLIGFINLKILLIHRGMYVFLGLSFISLTIFRLWRLPNKPYSNIYPMIASGLFLVCGLILGTLHVKESMRGENLRKEMILANNEFAGFPRMKISDQQIHIEHHKESIKVNSLLKAKNISGSMIDTLILSLNPGLKIDQIKIDSAEATYIRRAHLILVPLQETIGIMDSITILLNYSGTVDDEACYLDIDEKTRKKSVESEIVNIGKMYSCVRDRFVFMTPESNWYPSSNVGFNSKNILWMLPGFCTYRLEVKTEHGLTSISQGLQVFSDSVTRFTCDQPITGLSLIIGSYEKTSFHTQIPEIGVFLKPGHDYFSEAFTELNDTAEKIIYQSLEDYSLRLKMEYPFKQLYLLEVPVQCYAYQRFWSNHTEMLQPELIFISERGGKEEHFKFANNIKNRKENNDNKGLDDKQIQVEELKAFLSTFTKKILSSDFRFRNHRMEEEEIVNPYFIFDAFYAFNHPVESGQYPIFNNFLGSYCLKQGNTNGQDRFSYGFSEEEKAVLLLRKKSLSEIIINPDYNSLADNLILMKGDALFSLLEKKIGSLRLGEILNEIFSKYGHQSIPYAEFSNLMRLKTGIELSPLLETWLQSGKLPAFRIGRVDAFKIKENEHQRFLTQISIGNEGNIEGIVKIAIRETGNDQDREEENLDYKSFNIGISQIKTIRLLTDKLPSAVLINTNASMNIPVRQEISILKAEPDENYSVLPEETSEILTSWDPPGEIIVDNEDSLFSVVNISMQGMLVKLANKIVVPGDEYQGYMWWTVAAKWGKYINTMFYGRYVLSAACIRSGNGNAKAIWEIPIVTKGQYDLYTYIPKSKSDENAQHLGIYEYIVSHDDGSEKVIINCKEIEGGWVFLGTYYCSPGNTRVELNNKSNSRIVIADAIKAVKISP